MATQKTFETATNSYFSDGVIGEGGAGTVYRVLDAEKKVFAIKLLRDSNSTKRKRFKNELAFCRQNEHSGILKVLDEGFYRDAKIAAPFYVMPFYESTLRELIRASVPVPNALALFLQVLDGMEAAHLQKVVHRDLKPENILVKQPEPRLVVSDFGIAHFEEANLLTLVDTSPGDRLANYRYSAPEQRTPGAQVDLRADIFALGLILNEMFTGEVPQGTAHRMIGDVDQAFAFLDPLVDKMIRQRPDERPGSIRAIKSELELSWQISVTHQKIDAINKTVVPMATPDDPLGGADVIVSGFNYDSGLLTFRFEPEPPPGWFQALHGLGSFGYILGSGPHRVERTGSRTASISTRENDVEAQAKFVQEWASSANVEYRRSLKVSAQRKAQERQKTLDSDRARLAENKRAQERLRKANLL